MLRSTSSYYVFWKHRVRSVLDTRVRRSATLAVSGAIAPSSFLVTGCLIGQTWTGPACPSIDPSHPGHTLVTLALPSFLELAAQYPVRPLRLPPDCTPPLSRAFQSPVASRHGEQKNICFQQLKFLDLLFLPFPSSLFSITNFSNNLCHRVLRSQAITSSLPQVF